MARADFLLLCELIFCFAVIFDTALCAPDVSEILRNTPPQLNPTGSPGDQVQARFLPFAASFSLGAGNNAQSFSVAGGPEGVGLSQSSSHGNSDFTSSQSSSLAAGLTGISASDANAVSGNHPLYGPNAQANGNSFSLGQGASSAAHGNVINGQAVTGAQSSIGSTHSQASSGVQQNFAQHHQRPGRPAWTNAPPSYASGAPVGNYNSYYQPNSNGRPSLTISVSDSPNRYGSRGGSNSGWYQVPDNDDVPPSWGRKPDICRYRDSWFKDPRCQEPRVLVGKPGYSPVGGGYQHPYYDSYGNVNRDPRESASNGVAQVSAGSSAQSGVGGLSIGQSSSQSGNSNQGSGALTINQVQTSGNAQAHAQGVSGHVQQNPATGVEANLSSGSISASSGPGGSAQGTSVSSSSGSGKDTNSQVTSSSKGSGSAHGSANSATVAFPGLSSHSHEHSLIPQEFVRSGKVLKDKKKKKKKEDDEQGPIEELITDLTDAVYDIFE